MTDTAQLRAPETAPAGDDEERLRTALLAALRVARARAMRVVTEIDCIGLDLKGGYISPSQALRECLYWRIDSLFPRESDGA